MATHKLLLLPGDGIGPEVMAEVKRLIDWLNAQGIAHFETEHGLVGGAAYDASKQSITDATMAQAHGRGRRDLRRGRRPEMGQRCPTRRGPRPGCCACARTSACSPICVRRCAIRRWRMPRA